MAFIKYNFLHILYLIFPLFYLATGLLFKYKPPKYTANNYTNIGVVNKSYGGYKTASSTKSKKNWDIAQQLFASYLIKSAIIIFPITIISFILYNKKLISANAILIVTMALLIMQMIGCFIYCEITLKRKTKEQ